MESANYPEDWVFACVSREYGIDPFEIRQRWTWAQFFIALDCLEYHQYVDMWWQSSMEERLKIGANKTSGARGSSRGSNVVSFSSLSDIGRACGVVRQYPNVRKGG